MIDMKFKFWDKFHKEWYQVPHYATGPYLDHLGHPLYIHQKDCSVVFHFDLIPLLYTGLKDKNGVEIYESDILLIQDTRKERILDDGSGPTEPCNHLSAVVFQGGAFGVAITDSADIFSKGFWSFERLIDEDDGDLEVIGNIFENKELL